MARIFADVASKVISVYASSWSDALPAPSNASAALAFDDSTNPTLADAVLSELASYSVVAGVLQHNGQPVAVAADSQNKQTLDALMNGAATALANNQTFLALPAPSNVQTIAQVQALTRQVNQIIKRLVLLGRSVA